jgi:hypothetical protein
MIELSFWRGFPPMLASFWIGALVIQLDLVMIAHLGTGALAGYALISRVAVLDAALTAAVGSISLIVVSRAHTGSPERSLLNEIWICAIILGLITATVGALAYPILIELLANQGPAINFARSAIFIFVAATPLRMFVSATSFVLHSLGRGGIVLAWQVCETAVKAALNAPLISLYGFDGCFVATFLVSILSVIFALMLMTRIFVSEGKRQDASFRWSFIRGCMVESSRGLAPQLAVFASFALFALSETSPGGMLRLDAYATVQGVIVFVLAPLTAATRFFAMRFAGRSPDELKRLLSTLLLRGGPLLCILAGAFVFGRDAIGAALYGDLGIWWSSFVATLALSLPLRYAGALLRGALLSRGRIGAVAIADSVAPWLVALPLIAFGLLLDQPAIACLSMLAPEVACVLWFWRSQPFADAISGRFASDLQLS